VRVEVLRVLDERFGAYDVDEGFGGEVSCALPLCGPEGALGLVVLAELGLDVVVDALDFLSTGLAAIIKYECTSIHLLQRVDQVCDGLVGSVLDLIPLEVAQVLVDGLYVM
jgi:hypothetical protein